MAKKSTTGKGAKERSSAEARSKTAADSTASGKSTERVKKKKKAPAGNASAKTAVKAPAKTPPAKAPAKAPAKTGTTGASLPAAAKAEKQTTLCARVDIGFGNTLFVRGEGPGLTWERGMPMDCLSADEWIWSTPSTSVPVVCKVLINDEIWSSGEDFRIPGGQRLVCYPSF